MKIGIVRPYEVEFNPGDVADLEEAIKKRGHIPIRIYVDMLEVRIGGGGVAVRQAVGRGQPEEVDVPGAILRHLGIFRDFEQFLYRVWAARALEESGAYVMNPVLPWVVTGDKMAALMKLAKAGLPVPPTVVTENMFVGYRAVAEFGRAVVKQMRGAMGYGVFLVDNPDVAFHIFSALVNLNKPIYVQKFLEKGSGDYRVVVVGGRVIGAEYRRGEGWKTNVAQGAKPEPARATPQMEELAVRAVEALGLDYGGVDIAETSDGYYILEVNPTMSWQGFKQATGINPAEHIVDYLLEKIKK
ncbi:ATP-grasp domain-containing protein [Pyrobaculum aerophilum]|uniref:ATP-grasp domain-containing protein n=1 Tax=Pyrobaculum aerophilum TaxID=13773 RepID=UPI0023F4C7DF|nr:RimK family alpha-L-glutamate ligase [Pyrobaculum aerophilum]MCX8137535.1 RimK family alpha-L-glutamate ligase [Pyrobaculum aerophilum]